MSSWKSFEGEMMKKFGSTVVAVILFIIFLPVLPLLAWDIVRIMWNDVPWWAQMVIIVVGVLMTAGALRKLFKVFRGDGRRSGRIPTIHIHNHYR